MRILIPSYLSNEQRVTREFDTQWREFIACMHEDERWVRLRDLEPFNFF